MSNSEENIKLVEQRLLLAKWILEKSDQEIRGWRNEKNIIYSGKVITHQIPAEFTNSIWFKHMNQNIEAQPISLVLYLLLTCFDKLGQPENYVDFTKWMNSSQHSEERNKIISEVSENENMLEGIKHIYGKYQEKYGVKRSFFRFMDSVLQDKYQKMLFECMVVEEIPKPNHIINEDGSITSLGVTGHRLPNDNPDSTEKKKRLLYTLRNNFTHGLFPFDTHFSRSSTGISFTYPPSNSNWIIPLSIDNTRKTKEIRYMVSIIFPFLLFYLVSSSIGKTIKISDFDIMFEVDIFFTEIPVLAHTEFNLQELKDPNFIKKICFESIKETLNKNGFETHTLDISDRIFDAYQLPFDIL